MVPSCKTYIKELSLQRFTKAFEKIKKKEIFLNGSFKKLLL